MKKQTQKNISNHLKNPEPKTSPQKKSPSNNSKSKSKTTSKGKTYSDSEKLGKRHSSQKKEKTNSANSQKHLFSSHILVTDNFSKQALPLREHFESRFSQPKSNDSQRFVWDYWYLENQYILHRTPAYHFFPENLYMKLHRELVQWGRKNLGCWDISPPWLSYYINGSRQELHSDVPHGPWAFVFSITDLSQTNFLGGETMILKPEVLSYWNGFGSQQDRELNSFVDFIPSPMNRLTVFDPRYPHGVREVRGTQDPMKGRIVIHGWFMEPKTYIEGTLPSKACEKILNIQFEKLQNLLTHDSEINEILFSGTISLQLTVNSQGKVSQIRFATNTLLTTEGLVPEIFNEKLLTLYRSLEFPVSNGKTEMTIPLVFQ